MRSPHCSGHLNLTQRCPDQRGFLQYYIMYIPLWQWFHSHTLSLSQANIKDSDVMDMLLTVTLDFIDDYLSIITDRKTKILTESFKGPQQDIGFSLDHHNPELITRESWLDLSDTILSSMKKTWKTSKKGFLN